MHGVERQLASRGVGVTGLSMGQTSAHFGILWERYVSYFLSRQSRRVVLRCRRTSTLWLLQLNIDWTYNIATRRVFPPMRRM